MEVVILCAGRGERIRPLTDNNPKCMISFKGKTLINHQLNIFKKNKIKKINIILGYKHKKFFSEYKVNKIINRQFASTNMVYSLMKAKNILANKNIIVSYGDIIFDKTILKKLLKSKNEISVISDENFYQYWKLRTKNPLNDLETFQLAQNKRIIDIGNAPRSINDIQGQFIGLIKIDKKVINQIIELYQLLLKINFKKNKKMQMTNFLDIIIKLGFNVKAVPVKNGWLEFDTYKDYKIYNKLDKEKKLKKYYNVY